MKLVVFVILGLEHSGTTLLSRLLAAASDGVGLGGLKNFERFVKGQRGCSCGEQFGTCSFWAGVDRNLERLGHSSSGVAESLKNHKAASPEELEAVQCLLKAISLQSGKTCFVESSRSASWAQMLENNPDIDLVPVHIFKTPEQQLASAKRKGRSTRAEMVKYIRRNLTCHRARLNEKRPLPVPYSSLSSDPEKVVADILAKADLQFDPAHLRDWNYKVHHMLGGNRMLHSGSSRIEVDQSWRDKLSPLEIASAKFLGGPTLRRCLRV